VPALATKDSVLDGRAEVVSYVRDTSVFYLRVRVPQKQGYRSRRIDGVSTLPEAIEKALDTYMDLGTPSHPKPPRRGTKEGTKVSSRSALLNHLAAHLVEQEEKCEARVIKPSTLKNKKETLLKHLQGYLLDAGITKVGQIKVGCFDRYQVWRIEANAADGKNPPSNLTLKKEATIISGFIGYLVKKRLLDPYEAAQKQDIPPKIRLTDTDFDSNPPIRDIEEWLKILVEVRAWVKEGKAHPRPRTLLHRQMFWSLLLVLKQTGMRPDEARSLRWRDIETEDIGRFSQTQWEEDMAYLRLQGVEEDDLDEDDRRSLGRVSRYVTHIRILQSKTKSIREVTSNSAEALSRWKLWQKQYLSLMQQCGNGYNYEISEDDLVYGIPERDAVTITSYNVLNINWRSIIDRCGSKLKGPIMSDHKYTIYSLRSTRAQELMDMGVDVYLAATQLGHTVAMLEKVYARLPQRRRATKEAAHIEFGKRKSDSEIVSLDSIASFKG
jgi:integrase